MLKKWLSEIVAFIICASSITSLYGADFSSSGKQIIAEVQVSYQRGEYDRFLKQLHEQYEKAGKAGILRGIFESQKAAQIANKDSAEENQPKELLQKRNRKLLDAISEDNQLAIAQKVDNIVFFQLNKEHATALKELDSLRYELPENKGTTKNRISSLETEYFIKGLLLDGVVKKESQELQKKKIAITFEKLDKMEDICKEMTSTEWLDKISNAREGFRSLKAYQIDLASLRALAKGEITTKNSVEEKVKGIMMEYLQH